MQAAAANVYNPLHNKIQGFFGEYAFLGNDFQDALVVGGITYPTVDHAFASQKTDDISIKEQIAKMRHGDLDSFVDELDYDHDFWVAAGLAVMLELLQMKFSDITLAKKLLDTGQSNLINDNTDTFWGMTNGRGQNWLGRLLMIVRSQIAVNPPE